MMALKSEDPADPVELFNFSVNLCPQIHNLLNVSHKLDNSDTSQIASSNNYEDSVCSAETKQSYECSTCQRVFVKKSNYRYHLKTHWVKSHACPICHKSFLTKQALSVHSSSHQSSDQRPFTCRHCSKSFQTNQNLKNHENIHLGIKPFRCVHCNKSFREKSSLTKHLVAHSGVKPYACAHCSKKFTQSSSLQRHVTQFHSTAEFGGFLPALGAAIVARELMMLEKHP